MKSLLVAIAFTVLCYVNFADSQAGDGRSVPSRPYPEPGGYNIQYHAPHEQVPSETTGNFGTDGMQNGGLRSGSIVNFQNNKEMSENSPQRFMSGNLPGRTSTDGRQFNDGSAWRPVNNGATPIGNLHLPAGQGPNVGGWNSGANASPGVNANGADGGRGFNNIPNAPQGGPVNNGATPIGNLHLPAGQGPNVGGWNSGANALPGVNANGADGGRGFNNIPNAHQGGPGNVGNHFSDFNKGGGKFNPDLIKDLISSLLRKGNAGAPLKSGSFEDGDKARNGYVANEGTSGPGGIQRNNNAGDNFPMRNFAEGYGRGPVRNGVPNPNGQPAIRQPDSSSSVRQTEVRPENIPVAGELPHQNNVPNSWVPNEGTRVINAPGVVQNYDSRSGLSNSNINRNPWNGPFGTVHKPFLGEQTVFRPVGMPHFAQLPAIQPGGIPPQQVAQVLAVRPGVISKEGGLFHSSPNIKNANNKVSLVTTNSPTTAQKQTIVYPKKSVSRKNKSTNQETAYGYYGTTVSNTSELKKTDSIEDNGSGNLDNSSQLVGSDTENVKEAPVPESNNGGDTSGTTESQSNNDEIHKSQKKKGKKSKGKKGKSKKGKSKKRKSKKRKSKKSKTTSGSKSAAHSNSDKQIDDATWHEIFSEGGHAAKGGDGGIKECFDDE